MCSQARKSLPARRCIWDHGTSGCSWRGPRRRTTRRGALLRNPDRHESVRWRALLVALCLGIAAIVAACGSSDDSGGGGNSTSGGGGSLSTKKIHKAGGLKKPGPITGWAWAPRTDEGRKKVEAGHPHIKGQRPKGGAGPPHHR